MDFTDTEESVNFVRLSIYLLMTNITGLVVTNPILMLPSTETAFEFWGRFVSEPHRLCREYYRENFEPLLFQTVPGNMLMLLPPRHTAPMRCPRSRKYMVVLK